MANGRGGARPGAGRKPKAQFEKEAIRAKIREMVADQIVPLVDAQLSNAKGLRYLVTRDKKSGKFIRVTEAMARSAQDTDLADSIEVWEKEPNVSAFMDLLNRTIDRPTEAQPEEPWKGELTVKWQD